MRSSILVATAVSLTVSAGIAAAAVDEIVIYAQKKGRAENLQEVPAAVSAYNSGQLDGIVFEKLDDLSYSIPNVQLEQVGTFPGVQNFSIRGQGINSSIPSVDPTVGVFIDGIYQGTTYGTVLDTWDLESVEILRGPQGLLFGRNVTGGAVTVRTARPDPQGEAAYKFKALITDEERYSAAAAFEAPFIDDVLAGKIMLYYDNDDGYFVNNNLTSGAITSPPFISFDPVSPPSGSSQRNAGEFKTKIIRPSLVWAASDALEVALIGEYGKAEGDGAAWTVVSGGLPAPLVPVPIGSVSGGGQAKFSTTSNDYGFAEVDWKSATLEVNWDIAGGVLTSITGWKDVEQESATDVDGTYLPAFVATGFTAQDQISEELRFSTTIGDNWEMTVGAYYLNIDLEYREGRYIQINPANLMLAPDLLRIGLGGDMETTTYGVFINNEYAITDSITLLAGLRYSDEEKDARIIDGPIGLPIEFCPDVTTFMCSFDDLEGDWDYWTPKLGAQWDFAEDAQAYAFWTKGYRAGGFNFRNAKPGPIPPLGYPAGPTREEEQSSYEIGLKSEVFDNKLRMNIAYFNNDIKDMQRELNQGDPDVIVLQATINAGDVTIKGVEFEFNAVPTDAFSIWGSLGYLDGKYDSINPLYTGINPATGAPYIGAELPRLARWSFSLGSSYDFSLDGNGVLRLQADYGYRDPNYYDDANTQLFDTQHRLGGSINWISPDDQWTVSLFGKNLRDEANYGNLTSIAGLFTAGPMQKGREYGLQVQFRSQ